MSSHKFIQKGTSESQKGNHAKAVEYYTQGIDMDPDNPTLLVGRATSYHQLSKFDEALQDAAKLVRVDSSCGDGYYRQGLALMELNRFEEAIKAFEAGLAHATLDEEEKVPFREALTACQEKAKHSEIREWVNANQLPRCYAEVLRHANITTVRQLQESKNLSSLGKHMQDQIRTALAKQSRGISSRRDQRRGDQSCYTWSKEIQDTPALVFVGDMGVGKSTLCNSFLKDSPFKTSDSATAATQDCQGAYIPDLGFTVVDVPGFNEVVPDGKGRSNEEIIQVFLQYLFDHNLKVLGFIICSTPLGATRLPISLCELFLAMSKMLGSKFCYCSRMVFTRLKTSTPDSAIAEMVQCFQSSAKEGVWRNHAVEFPGALVAPFDGSNSRSDTEQLEVFALLQLQRNFSFCVDWGQRKCTVCNLFVKSRVKSRCFIHPGVEGGGHPGPFEMRHPQTKKEHKGEPVTGILRVIGAIFTLGLYVPNKYMSCCKISAAEAFSEDSGCVERCLQCNAEWPTTQKATEGCTKFCSECQEDSQTLNCPKSQKRCTKCKSPLSKLGCIIQQDHVLEPIKWVEREESKKSDENKKTTKLFRS